jgi:hypothetical protein
LDDVAVNAPLYPGSLTVSVWGAPAAKFRDVADGVMTAAVGIGAGATGVVDTPPPQPDIAPNRIKLASTNARCVTGVS